MSYTIVGMFPTNEDADQASNELNSAGFQKEDYQISRYSTTGEYHQNSPDYDFEEDEKTTGFWNWLFGEDEDQKKKYSYAGTKSNLITVYTEDISRAEKARDLMNENGAINVNEFTRDRFSTPEKNDISSEERARIIAKAKNNLYFTNENRTYSISTRGMESDMDSQGSDDTF